MTAVLTACTSCTTVEHQVTGLTRPPAVSTADLLFIQHASRAIPRIGIVSKRKSHESLYAHSTSRYTRCAELSCLKSLSRGRSSRRERVVMTYLGDESETVRVNF